MPACHTAAVRYVSSARPRRGAALALAAILAAVPAVASAHGAANPSPTFARVVTNWEVDPFLLLPLAATAWLYLAGVRRVARPHPRSPFPRRRTAYFFAGISVLLLAGMSPIAGYEGDLFAVHMVQHILIVSVAAPLLLLGTPITLALRAASPRVRRERLLPLLHSGFVRALSFPVFTWLFLAVTMWLSHFTPLFNVALEHVWWHRAEHGLYLSAALLFWWPVVSLEPGPWRLGHPARLFYVFLQMPQSSFLAVAIYNAEHVIFAHYRSVARTWGPTPLQDQQLAGIIMWVGGDAVFLIALVILAYGWVKQDEREALRQDRARAREKAAALPASAAAGDRGR